MLFTTRILSSLIIVLALNMCTVSQSKSNSAVIIPAVNYLLSDTTPPPHNYDTTITTTSGDKIGVDKLANGLIFEGHKGQIILLEYFATWCPHCQDMIPIYNRLKNQYPNDVFIIAIEDGADGKPGHPQRDNAYMQAYVKQMRGGIQYSVVATENYANLRSYFLQLTGHPRYAYPGLLILNKNGNMSDYHLGEVSYAELNAIIQNLGGSN